MKTYSAEGLNFDAPEQNVRVDKLGVGCFEVRLVGKDPAAMTVWVDVAVKDKEMVSKIPGNLLDYLKMTYLGAEPPVVKKVSRAIGGKTIEGDQHTSKNPVPSTLEVFRFDLPDGSVAGVSFARADGVSAADAESFHAQIASTLRLAQ